MLPQHAAGSISCTGNAAVTATLTWSGLSGLTEGGRKMQREPSANLVPHLSKIKLAALNVDVSQQKPRTLVLISFICNIVDLLNVLQLIPAAIGPEVSLV